MTGRALTLLALGAAASVAACGPGGGPSSETCAGGERDVDIDTLSLYAREGGVNKVLENGDVVPMTFGTQGSGMLIVGLRVTGRNIPDCVRQQTIAETPSGMLIDDEFRSMSMRQDLDGAWVTGQILLIVSWAVGEGDAVVLRGAMGDLEVERFVYVDRVGIPPRPDAGPRSDAGPADAGVPDADVSDAGGDASPGDAGLDAATADAGDAG